MVSIFEKMAKRYNTITGENQRETFLYWLDGFEISNTDESLKEVYNDPQVWEELKQDCEDYEE